MRVGEILEGHSRSFSNPPDVWSYDDCIISMHAQQECRLTPGHDEFNVACTYGIREDCTKKLRYVSCIDELPCGMEGKEHELMKEGYWYALLL